MLDNELNHVKEKSFLEKTRDDYLSFKGRLNRKPFILRSLGITIVPVLLMVWIFYLFAGGFPPNLEYQHKDLIWIHVTLHLLLMIVPVISGFSLGVRRCHDLNLSGWWLLLGTVPYVSVAWAFYLMCKKGTEGQNAYGEDLLSKGE